MKNLLFVGLTSVVLFGCEQHSRPATPVSPNQDSLERVREDERRASGLTGPTAIRVTTTTVNGPTATGFTSGLTGPTARPDLR